MYATADDFVLRIGEQQAIELTDRDRTGEINQQVLAVALTDSSSQIDGYLLGRYPLPLVTVPDNLVRICCDIARYRLVSMSEVTTTDEIIERYKLSLKELEQIASGKISLGIATTDNTTDDSVGVVFSNSNNRIFSRDNSN
ncbi:gp436 family protein [Gallibacterium anatis]|uniref:gp436 family protein n=1 Tax=Gallibacterium anatis TaxID=750 RepID=UPI0039FDC04D